MNYLVKTNDISTLTDVGYNRIVYDSTTGFVYCKGANVNAYVDLGLPSQLKWAKWNIGAKSEEEPGLYFQWGDTQGYTAEQVGDGEGLKAFSYADYKWGSPSNFSRYNASDKKTVLDPEDDAAHVIMGGNWRMPTLKDYKELFSNTDIYLVPTEGEEIQVTPQEHGEGVMINWASQLNGSLKGIKFYKQNNKQTYMFVPFAGYADRGSVRKSVGYVWASSLDSSNVQTAWSFGFGQLSGILGSINRNNGLPVRGVLAQ